MRRLLAVLLASSPLLASSLEASAGSKKEEAEYLAFLKLLPGEYDNLTQADDSGGEVQPLILSIKPQDLQLIGRLVMLVRETAANDPNRLLAQHVWTVERSKEKDKSDEFVQHVYQFKEPQRWVRAGTDPLLLQSLLPDDLQQMSGCEIYWTRNANGAYTGTTRPHACRPLASEEGHLIEIGAALSNDELALTEIQAGAGGRLPPDTGGASTVHYQRRGG